MAGNVRRVWDKELYERKARERAALGDGNESEDEEKNGGGKRIESAAESVKEEFRPAEHGAAGPQGSNRAFIKAREGDLGLDSNVGKTQIVSAAAIEAGVGAGYFCEVCSCTLKDSTAYLDHINGKKHQRALGFSMRVERVGVDTVKEKLEALKRKLAEGSGASSKAHIQISSVTSHAATLPTATALDEEMKKKRKREEQEARRRENEAAQLEGADPEIQELLGFASFGGGGKKR